MTPEKLNNGAGFSEPAPDLPRLPEPAPEITAAGLLDIAETERVVPKGKPGPPRGSRNAWKHGLRTRKRSGLDRRRSVDRRVLAALRAIEESLGGQLTPQRAAILAGVGRRLRDLAKIEAFEEEKLGGQIAIGGKRKSAVHPIVELKWKLLDSIDRALEKVGLDAAKRQTGLGDYLAAASARKRSSLPQDAPEPHGGAAV